VEEVYNKTVHYVLFESDGSEFEQSKDCYNVLWFDPKMKNYELLVAFIKKKRIAFAEINPFLIVDKTEHMEGVTKIWSEKPLENSKVLLSRPLTE